MPKPVWSSDVRWRSVAEVGIKVNFTAPNSRKKVTANQRLWGNPMETTGRKELVRWILSWMPDVKVLMDWLSAVCVTSAPKP
jgi:hypothetical protein